MLESTEELYELGANINNLNDPTDRDKDLLLYKLNRQLTEDEHLYIFTELLQNHEKKIYTITENCTLFDLNDLSSKNFWKLYYYAELCIKNHERQKELALAEDSHISNLNNLSKKMKVDLENFKSEYNQIPENQSDLSHYEKLRIGALSQCSYSVYAKTNNQPNIGLTLHDDKKLGKTIYSDTFKHKWNDNSIMKNVPMIGKNSIVIEEINKESPDLDSDDDDLMINENYDDTKDYIDNEMVEVNHLKNQLLKIPKKLQLKKTMTINSDDENFM